MDVQHECLKVLRICFPTPITCRVIADEIGADVRATGRALYELDKARKLVRVRTSPNGYRLSAQTMRELHDGL